MKMKFAKTLLAVLLAATLPVTAIAADADTDTETTTSVWEIDDFESYTLLKEALITYDGLWETGSNAAAVMSLDSTDSAPDGNQSLQVYNDLLSYGWSTIRYAPLSADRQSILNNAYINGTDVKLVFYAKADMENTIRITFLPNLTTPNYGVFEAYVTLTTEWTRYELSLTDDFTCRNTSPNDDAVTNMNAIEGAATLLKNGTNTGLRYIEICTNKNEGYTTAAQFTYWLDSLSFVGEDVTSNVATEDDDTGVMGDYDGDGNVTASDALQVLRVAVGLQEVSDDATFARIDMDGNDEISATDALKVLQVAVGAE